VAVDAAYLAGVAGEDFCYLTTTGRVSGKPHTIEIWFAVHDGALYMMAGGGRRADWVRNLAKEPAVTIAFGRPEAEAHAARAQVIDAAAQPEQDALARRLLAGKYQGWSDGKPLSGWAQTALPVVIRF
jgi:deazaflavin-dependent oxidoreductase (nitroreductase family)